MSQCGRTAVASSCEADRDAEAAGAARPAASSSGVTIVIAPSKREVTRWFGSGTSSSKTLVRTPSSSGCRPHERSTAILPVGQVDDRLRPPEVDVVAEAPGVQVEADALVRVPGSQPAGLAPVLRLVVGGRVPLHAQASFGSFEDLDRSRLAVDADAVAGADRPGAVAGVDDARDPQLARDDGRVAERAADVDHQRRGDEHDRGPARVGRRARPGSRRPRRPRSRGRSRPARVPSTTPALTPMPSIEPSARAP